MEKLVHPMLRMGKFMHRMGVIQGGVGYVRVSRNKRLEISSRLYALKVRGYPQPLWLRAVDSDSVIFGQVMIDWQYNLPQVDEVRLIVDCGANIGMSALYFARRYPRAKIIAIEPHPDNYAMLLRNTKRVPQIHPVQAAVWPRPTNLKIVDEGRSFASAGVAESPTAESNGVGTVQLRDLVAGNGTIDILKIDIEGSEKALFEDPSCEEWLANTRVIYAELHDWMKPGSASAFYRAITRFDFSQHHLGEIVAIELKHSKARPAATA